MIRDLDEHPGSELEGYDLCIVGSGPAGVTLAVELAGAGLRLLLLESGKRRPTARGDRQRRVQSDGIRIKDYSRERVLGGASTTWAGLSSPLDPIDFRPRGGAHQGWPIPRDELLPYWVEAAARYRFASPVAFSAEGFGRTKQRGDVELAWRDVEEKIFLAADPPQDFAREQLELLAGPEVDVFLDATLLRLERGADEDVGEAASVARGVARTSSGRELAVHARVFVLATGGLENARLLLSSTDVCPAGLGNEHDQVGRYLMNHPKNNFGTISLGRPVRELPYHFGCLFAGFAGYAGLRLTEAEQERRDVLNSYVRFEPLFPWSGNRGVEAFVLLMKHSGLLLRLWKDRAGGKLVSLRDYSETGDDSDLANERKSFRNWLALAGLVLLHLPTVLRYACSRLANGRAPPVTVVRLRNFMEMEPHPDNRVVLGASTDEDGQRVTVVRHETTARDRRSLLALHEVLGRELAANGFGTLRSGLAAADPWPIDMDASHHMGTTRMGADPASSVVDPDGRLHSVPNVYLAGASVFPTSGCANPTFTIVALSIRLARHLRERFGVPAREPAAAAPRPSSPAREGARRVLVVGAGQRVTTDVLPALASLPHLYSVEAVVAKHGRTLQAAGRDYEVLPLDMLDGEQLLRCDLVYVAVSKGVVPRVLARLLEHDVSGIDLVLDTPVLQFKHVGHARQLSAFRNAWVAEDCTRLPWIDLVVAVQSAGLVGPLRRAVFDRAAYRYHGLALLKTLLGSRRLVSARRTRVDADTVHLDVRLANGTSGRLVDPRDYARGSFVLSGAAGALTDDPGAAAGALLMQPVVRDGLCTGFRCGELEVALHERESLLLGPMAPGERLTARMDDLKRVGLARLLTDIAEGRGAYPLEEGLDDMAVDFYLEKLGRYRASSLTSVKSALARRLLGALTRVAGR